MGEKGIEILCTLNISDCECFANVFVVSAIIMPLVYSTSIYRIHICTFVCLSVSVCVCVPRCVRFVLMRFSFGEDFQILADLSKLNGMCRNVFKAFLGIGYVLALINYA